MDTKFVEVTDRFAYGKFLVCRMTEDELSTPSAMPGGEGIPLLSYAGSRRFNARSTLIIDLQRGTGAAWPLDGYAKSYEAEKLRGLQPLICPLYMTFVKLLDECKWQKREITDIPAYIDLTSLRTALDICSQV